MENEKYSFPVWMFICIVILGGVGITMVSNMNPYFYPYASEAIGVSRAQFSLYYSVQCLACMITLFFAGSIMTKFKKRLNLIASAAYLIIGCGYLAFSRATSLRTWFIIAPFMGFSVAFISFLLCGTLVNNWFHKKTGLIMGIYSASSSVVGALISPKVAVLVASDWRMGYVAVGVVCLCLIPFALTIKYSPELAGRKAWGDDEISEKQTDTAVVAVGVPYKTALKSVSFWLCVLMVYLSTAYANFTYAVPGHIKNVGHEPVIVGYVSSCYLVTSIAGKLLAGWLKDKIGVLKSLFVVSCFGIIGLVVLILFSGSVVGALGGAAFFGIAMGICGVYPPLLVAECFGSGRDYSKILSNVTTMVYVASMTVIPFYNLVYDLVGSYVTGMIVSVCALVICFFCAAAAVKASKKLVREL